MVRKIDLDCNQTEIYYNGGLIASISLEKNHANIRIPGEPFPSSRQDHSNDWNAYETSVIPHKDTRKSHVPKGWKFHTNVSDSSTGDMIFSILVDDLGPDRVIMFPGAYWKDGRFDPTMRSIWIHEGE